jgi:hypothetical protein
VVGIIQLSIAQLFAKDNWIICYKDLFELFVVVFFQGPSVQVHALQHAESRLSEIAAD